MLVLFLTLSCGYHVGRPAAQQVVWSVGAVTAGVAEPGLGDALAGGLARSLAARHVLGVGPSVEVDVIEARTWSAGASAMGQVHRARLEARFVLLGPAPRQVVLAAERSYSVLSDGSLQASAARAQVFSDLAGELCADATSWLLDAPAPESGP